MQAVYEAVDNVAKYDSTVLILGKSGVGKEAIVKRIHEKSKRRNGPLIRINCGAIPESLMESEMFGYAKGAFTGAANQGKLGLISLAHQGTLFLDELAELSMSIQVKLLRVIQELHFYPIGGVKPVSADIRLVGATNRDLKKLVEAGEFREDLYYRLNVVPIHMPTLSERKDDISELIQFFLEKFRKKYNKKKQITEEVMQLLIQYDWPGNIRELENIIERLLVTTSSDWIDVDSLPAEVLEVTNSTPLSKGATLKELLADYEIKLIKDSLARNRTLNRASKELGLDVSTLSRKCKKYHIPIGQVFFA